MKTIASKDSQDSHVSTGATPAPPDEVLTRVPNGTSAARRPGRGRSALAPRRACHADRRFASRHPAPTARQPRRLCIATESGCCWPEPWPRWRWAVTSWSRGSIRHSNTVSTDDAYVNGHVTFVAPRVSGQVMKVLVDDNQRVKKGDLLVQLDKEPYQVQVALKRAAVRVAEANLAAAESEGPRPGGPTRRPTLETPERLRAGRCPGRPLAVPGGRPAESGGHSRQSPGRFQARRGVVAEACHQPFGLRPV